MSAWIVRCLARSVVLSSLLASAAVRAEPEGYRGGEGRPPGTTYEPPGGGPSLTVRRVTVQAGRSDGRWSCGAVAVPRGSEDLVTVTLVISNPAKHRITGFLANFDLVIEHHGPGVEEGSCVRGAPDEDAEPDLGAKRSRIVRKHFLVPRGATPRILVYNDDDFPALFALPKPRRLPAKATRAPRSRAVHSPMRRGTSRNRVTRQQEPRCTSHDAARRRSSVPACPWASASDRAHRGLRVVHAR